MLKFYYDPKYKYTNRTIIDVSGDTHYVEKNYVNIDSPDTINGHIIYKLSANEKIPTYIVQDNLKKWFVSGITQLRSGKLQLSLLRDIISENPRSWRTEDAYISAGLATDFNKYKRWDLPYTNTAIRPPHGLPHRCLDPRTAFRQSLTRVSSAKRPCRYQRHTCGDSHFRQIASGCGIASNPPNGDCPRG